MRDSSAAKVPKKWLGFGLAAVVALAGVLGACGSDGGEAGTETTATSNGGNGSGGQTTGTAQGGDLQSSVGTSMTQPLVLDPPTGTIAVVDGMSTPLQLTATQNGQQVFPTSWNIDFPLVADVDNQGLVDATKIKGGSVIVTAMLGNETATATIDVTFKKTIDDGTITPGDKTKLTTATTPDATVQWAYPYDGTVWPQGLLGPKMMWNGGAATDAYYIHFTGPNVDVEVFTLAAPPSSYLIELIDWVAINESVVGGDVDVHVARLEAGAAAATVVIDHKWTMANGSLRGTVYYWSNNLGRIVRIKPGATAPEDFLQGTAAGPQCSTCHTVASGGSTMIIGGDVTATTYDLINDQVVMELTAATGKPVRNWSNVALSPDGQYVIENSAPLPGPPGNNPGLWEASTGTLLTNTGLDATRLEYPAFSPSGEKIAFVSDTAPFDLRTFDFDISLPMASNNQLIVTAANDPNYTNIFFPSVSPTVINLNSQPRTLITYHRGTAASSDTRNGPGDLFLADAENAGVEWRLENANGDNYPFAAGDRDRHYNYEPTFAPLASGGYLWAVFTSRRTYGNELTGAKNSVKQLWVAAINPDPQAGTDPSFPAFRVGGQDPATLNMRGFWALDPCIQQGDMCMDSGECCDGRPCQAGLCGGPKECVPTGGACMEDADCCDPSDKCLAGECKKLGPN